MDVHSSTNPSGAPDPPPPAWRWETFASWGLSGAIILMMVFVTSKRYFVQAVRAEMLITLFVSLFTFGIGLGFSGARQGGRENRFIAILAMAFHVILMLALLIA